MIRKKYLVMFIISLVSLLILINYDTKKYMSYINNISNEDLDNHLEIDYTNNFNHRDTNNRLLKNIQFKFEPSKYLLAVLNNRKLKLNDNLIHDLDSSLNQNEAIYLGICLIHTINTRFNNRSELYNNINNSSYTIDLIQINTHSSTKNNYLYCANNLNISSFKFKVSQLSKVEKSLLKIEYDDAIKTANKI